jgi:Protein of unknown function (DUF2934)
MKSDPESRVFKAQPIHDAILPNKNNKLPHIKSNSRQKLLPSLTKTLKQQIDAIPRQQWISDAAYYKAKARGFTPGYELVCIQGRWCFYSHRLTAARGNHWCKQTGTY